MVLTKRDAALLHHHPHVVDDRRSSATRLQGDRDPSPLGQRSGTIVTVSRGLGFGRFGTISPFIGQC
jgi:hypothetical protein